MKLQNFDIDLFLRDYWQKKPLLIRNALPDWENPLSPDELAGLSCEENIESRLIIQSADWSVAHGPLDAQDFAQLQGEIYTLLVQAVDHHIPEVSELLNQFRFIPNWRIDDIMVSYANTGGGVGAHYDQYDVFLLQGLGQRRWQIGQICDGKTALLPHDDLRLIADFQMQDEWVLNAGDILYVPPMLAHNGIAASDDCMTYSIGFRAPSQSELISNYSDHVLDAMQQDERYQDLYYRGQADSGEISNAAIDNMHKLMLDKIGDRDDFARWLGQFLSAPKYGIADATETQPENVITIGAQIIHNPASRFAYSDDGRSLYVDGEHYHCDDDLAFFAKKLCRYEALMVEQNMSDDVMILIRKLYARDAIALE